MAADAEAAAPRLRAFETEADLELISGLISAELSEPYTVFTYRYFIWAWPNLTYLAYLGGKCVGCVVGKAERQSGFLRGYIAMLVVEKSSRGRGIGTLLAERLIRQMVADGCDLIALEAEVTNAGALALYEKLGFLRDKRLQRYYLNGVDAFRLKLLIPQTIA